MFSSLRSRLWISYAGLIVVALSVMLVALGLYLWQNPLLNRQTLARLRTVETGLSNRWAELTGSDPLPQVLERASRAFEVRILVYDANGALIADSSSTLPAIELPGEPFLNRDLLTLRDSSGVTWLYTRRRLEDGRIMLVLTPRQRAPLLNFLRDELLPLFLRGGGVALLLSLLLAYAVARWIADPLQRLVFVTQHVPLAETKPVPEQGPSEVRELTRAFNAMVDRVQSSQISQRNFVANVSHELKTPLTSIQGFAQAILDGTAKSLQEQQKAAEIIYQESERMYRMVRDLLDLARLDAGTADLQMARVDLRVLLSGIEEKISMQARKQDLRIVVDCSPDLPAITGDGDRLAQVMTNLVDNAIKHTPSGGQVTLQARPSADGVEIRVADTGEGILPEALPHIFERFYQADASRAGGVKQGAGLGLAIVNEIVSAHGGRISVRSQKGVGTTFFMWFPRSHPDDTTLLQRDPQ